MERTNILHLQHLPRKNTSEVGFDSSEVDVAKKIYDLGFKIQDQMESPILGGAGNTEYLLHILP